MGRIRLRKVLGESPNSFVGEALGRGDFQSLWLGDRQEAEEAPPTHPVFVQRPLGEPSRDAVAERIIIVEFGLPHDLVRFRPIGKR
jgi:hypothetical protein